MFPSIVFQRAGQPPVQRLPQFKKLRLSAFEDAHCRFLAFIAYMSEYHNDSYKNSD
jgi:hypothetical protein